MKKIILSRKIEREEDKGRGEEGVEEERREGGGSLRVAGGWGWSREPLSKETFQTDGGA